MKTPILTAEDLAGAYTLAELAELAKCSTRTIRRDRAAGKIVAVRSGGTLLFPRRSVDAWIYGRTVKGTP